MKFIQLIIGIALLVLVLISGYLGDKYGCNIVLCDPLPESIIATNFINSHPVAAGNDFIPPQTERVKLDLRIPTTLRINNTPTVRLSYNEELEFITFGNFDFDENDGPFYGYQQDKLVSESFSVELGSSGFDIFPNQVIHIEKDETLPVKKLWTISPKKTGQHELIFNVENMWYNMGRIKNTSITLNGEDIPLEDTFSIPVQVLTEWGISERTEILIKGAISVIAFILMCPFILGVLKGKKSK